MKKVFFITVLFFALSITKTYPQVTEEFKNGSKPDDELNAEQIIEMNKPALISIWYNDKNYFSYSTYTTIDTTVLNGSGFIFSEDGLIGTNFHVVEKIDSLLVKTSEGIFYNAELLLTDETNDFAIIRLIDTDGKKFPVIKFGNSDNVKAGQQVFAIGSPLGFEYTISSGIIAAVRDNEKVSFSDPDTYLMKEKTFDRVLQITAAISPGNSGGALFNSKGEVIGITTYTYLGYGNLNFASAINTFKNLVKLEETKEYVNNSVLKIKKEENLFNTNYKLATDIKSQLAYEWPYYSKPKDSLSATDSFTVKQDSLNRVRLEKAEGYYKKCMDLKPDTFVVYQDLLDLYVITDNFSKAENLYKEIREKFESDSLLNLLSSNLATAYKTSKEYDKAIVFYNKMLKEDDSQYFIRYQIANIYQEKKDYKRAVEEYKKLLKADSSYNEANIQLGIIYYSKYRNTSRAKKYLQKAYEKELLTTGNTPYNFDLLYYIGMIAVKEGRKFDAILAYMDLKNIYTYSPGESEKKAALYREIVKMDE
ncbi:MAG: trypsin-like peptidase domain-containing protein [Bacteroidetes bacterium]|nr:trypsin-like peptidase domain-containing protein [Bacteroidota bacterium]